MKLTKKNICYPLVASLLLLLIACATPKRPSGGPKDITPPKIDSLKSTPSYQTQFNQREIDIYFDEFVVLEDAFNQVVVSPPLEEQPTIKLRNKKLTVKFSEDEVLRSNTTYVINFGNAIKDLTEGNIPPDLKFVFSTGNYIDSLELGGTIKDALTGEASENVLVMLYEDTRDSVVSLERPYYFAKTDKSGNFKITNIKSGTFKIFALNDNNFNYRYDLANEAVAFQENLITLNDSTSQNAELQLFLPKQKTVVNNMMSKDFGTVKVTTNQPSKDIEVVAASPLRNFQVFTEKDTLHIWYQNTVSPKGELVVSVDGVLDTLSLKIPDSLSFFDKNKKFKTLDKNNARIKKVHPRKPIMLPMQYPIQSIDTSKIVISQDSLSNILWTPSIEIDSLDPRNILVNHAWQENTRYRIDFLPSAIKSPLGIENDTITRVYQIIPLEDYGSIQLSISSLDSTKQYVFELKGKNDMLIDKKIINNQTAFSQNYSLLEAGIYSVVIVEDFDKNGEWSSGDYYQKKQPERIFRQELQELRKNWELEAAIKYPLE